MHLRCRDVLLTPWDADVLDQLLHVFRWRWREAHHDKGHDEIDQHRDRPKPFG